MQKDLSIIRMLFISGLVLIMFILFILLFNFKYINILYGWTTYVFINFSYFNYKLLIPKKEIGKFNKKTQIQVLKFAIDNYDGVYTYGLCNSLIRSIRHFRTNKDNNAIVISEFIPSFNYENCIELSDKYNFKKPDCYNSVNNLHYFWWPTYNTVDRLACLNALLQELEN